MSQNVRPPPVESASEVVTEDELFRQQETLVLRLRERPLNPPSLWSSVSKRFNSFWAFVEGNTEQMHNTVNESRADPATTAKNLKKLDKMFDHMERTLNDQREHAKEALDGMSAEEQEQFIEFFTAFTAFFKELFAALRELMMNVIKAIKSGAKIPADFFKNVFEELMECIKRL